ncbi:MAG: hypothetical protein OEY84_03475 [Rhodospirillaceae bacterium]|nr:hypothetical protein [Rhodospirillaceae bacterium]
MIFPSRSRNIPSLGSEDVNSLIHRNPSFGRLVVAVIFFAGFGAALPTAFFTDAFLAAFFLATFLIVAFFAFARDDLTAFFLEVNFADAFPFFTKPVTALFHLSWHPTMHY